MNKEKPAEKNQFEKAANTGWVGFKNLLVALTMIWPILLIGGVVLVVVRRYMKGRSE